MLMQSGLWYYRPETFSKFSIAFSTLLVIIVDASRAFSAPHYLTLVSERRAMPYRRDTNRDVSRSIYVDVWRNWANLPAHSMTWHHQWQTPTTHCPPVETSCAKRRGMAQCTHRNIVLESSVSQRKQSSVRKRWNPLPMTTSRVLMLSHRDLPYSQKSCETREVMSSEKEIATKWLSALVKESLDDILRTSFQKAESGIRLVVYKTLGRLFRMWYTMMLLENVK